MSKLSIRIYYEDTDAGGVVYYANYLKYIERARSEMLRELGFEQDQIEKDFGVLFVVRSMMANYLNPAKFNDLIDVQTEIKTVGKASLIFSQKIMNIRENTVLFDAEVKVVSVLTQNFKPCGIPQVISEKLNGRK
ncbi:MAG: tol-pal system-associated acyl-CoA thioesterase [Gammaproteobacteria bacterium]|nr:tol-pal system-associated acyl-CoA thioesterase [Gammaproteobacteria bacterium]